MITPTPHHDERFAWTGRVDGPGPEHRRWHSAVVAEGTRRADVALVGFRSDEGVRRNGGRPGAVDGPDEIRAGLASLALHQELVVTDHGDIGVVGADLEGAQERLGATVAGLLRSGVLPMVLGGGHETAFGSYTGLAVRDGAGSRRLGILNLDAHFDLREQPRASSGTPFLQMAAAEQEAGREFSYAVVGISRPNNTGVLFDTARRLGVRFLEDSECQETRRDEVLEFVAAFLEEIDDLHLTIDLDVLPASCAPGVSAPAALGVPLIVLEAVCDLVARSSKLALVDVVELNPSLDQDHRTARVAARLLHRIATSLPLNP